MLQDAASAGLGVALASELLSRRTPTGWLLPLSSHRVAGPNWNMLIHQESEGSPQCRAVSQWLQQQFAAEAATRGKDATL